MKQEQKHAISRAFQGCKNLSFLRLRVSAEKGLAFFSAIG
jgi:hypothetical protein